MNLNTIVAKCRDFSRPYRVTDGPAFRLKSIDPDDLGGFDTKDKPRAAEALEISIQALTDFQERLYAQNQWSVLLIFQAMDAAGKDGAIKHVMSGVNPQGCEVCSFKAPSSDDLDHDYLWRCVKRLPERGRIGIFNRSYYEEVLAVRVHPELLQKQQLPRSLIGKDIWKQRFEDIQQFESYLSRNGVLILKFFLHVSKREQKKRFLARLAESEKHWKFSPSDVHSRRFWRDYQDAYEDAIRNTATKDAPWHVVPADHKWFTRIVVAATVVAALDTLNLEFPKVSKEQLKELRRVQQELQREGNNS